MQFMLLCTLCDFNFTCYVIPNKLINRSPTLRNAHGHLSNPLHNTLAVHCKQSATVLLRTCVHQLLHKQYSHQQESHGDWLAIPHGDPVCQTLSTRFGVRGIPALKVSPILNASERFFLTLQYVLGYKLKLSPSYQVVACDGTELSSEGRNEVRGV